MGFKEWYEQNKKKFWIGVALASLFLIALIGVAVYFLVFNKKGTSKSGLENLSEGNDKESFIFTNDGTSEFNYVKTYLESSNNSV